MKPHSFAEERLSNDLMMELVPLLASHWEEVAHFKDIPLDPDFGIYSVLSMRNELAMYTVRKEGKLVGYAAFFLRANPHYKTSIQAVQDVIYIDPAERGTMPLRFLKFCDEKLKERGAQAVYHHVKVAHNFGKILERQGYELVDLIYTRRLDKEN